MLSVSAEMVQTVVRQASSAETAPPVPTSS
jgi:hypothetical protein